MPTKIRLQRFGKKGRPFYHIVIADGRAPRDGKFIEKLGTYNPLTKPADIDLNFDRALYWLQCGAQPTDTTRAILSYKGVMYKNHLLKGVAKGALTEEQAEAKFQNWITEKEAKVKAAANEHQQKLKDSNKKRIAEELKISNAKAQLIAEKRAKENLALDAEAKANETVTEETSASTEEVTEQNDAAVAENIATTTDEVKIPETEVSNEEPKAE